MLFVLGIVVSIFSIALIGLLSVSGGALPGACGNLLGLRLAGVRLPAPR